MHLAFAVAFAQAPAIADELKLGPGLSLTIYNQDFAVVKERRNIVLAPGRQTVTFSDVAAQIDPTSVHFIDLTDPATTVVAQNYEFDLVSADKLLLKYIDRPLKVVTQDGSLLSGTLMSFDANQLVLQSPDGSLQMVPRYRNVKDIQFSQLPAGLLTKPTLLWLLNAPKPGTHLVKTAYISAGFDWRADYTLALTPDEKFVNLSGWVTISNNSGSRYSDAQVKLMAGEVHRVLDQFRPEGAQAGGRLAGLKSAAEQVVEKAFAEYHLYTVTRNVNLNDRQTKQLEFMNRSEIPITKKYYYRTPPDWWRENSSANLDVEVHFRNDQKSNLGIPLPAGVVRLYKPDSTGDPLMLGQTSIQHTPKDEDLKFLMGRAFDLVAQRKVLALRRPAIHVVEQDVEITLRNHKNEPVSVTAEERMLLYPQWQILKESDEHAKPEVQTAQWTLSIPPDSQKQITYTVRYWW